MGLGSFFSNLNSNIASGAKKLKNLAHNATTGISSAISTGAKKGWEVIKEHGPEIASAAFKGAEYIGPYLGPKGIAVAGASKIISPHLAKAIGGNFEKRYNLSRFEQQPESSESPTYISPKLTSSTQSSPKHISQGLTPGVKQAIPTSGLPADFRAKVSFK
jgi:hypothetical protein